MRLTRPGAEAMTWGSRPKRSTNSARTLPASGGAEGEVMRSGDWSDLGRSRAALLLGVAQHGGRLRRQADRRRSEGSRIRRRVGVVVQRDVASVRDPAATLREDVP